NIFPSGDTGVCAASMRAFNVEAAKSDNVVILGVSKDPPFEHKRFCAADEIEQVVSASELRDGSSGEADGVRLQDGPMPGLLSRAVVVIDESGTVIYTEQVPEIVQEPDYASALAALKK